MTDNNKKHVIHRIAAFHTPLTDGGAFRVMFDEYGPLFVREYATGEVSEMTMDDASLAHTFLHPPHPQVDIREEVERALRGEWIFEVGVSIQWEPLSDRKFFRSYETAEEYANSIIADGYNAEIVPHLLLK